jgi:hypothetical protein
VSAGAALGADVARALDLSQVETPCFVTDLGALEPGARSCSRSRGSRSGRRSR